MKHTPKNITLENIFMGDNVRLPQNLRLAGLKEDIENRGLMEPITVVERDGDKYEVVKGHRRTTAITQIRETAPKAFQKLFGKGVPTFVLSGLTDEEIMEHKVDHGTEESLTDPHEVQMCANLLFAAGHTEGDVAIQLCGLFDRISPMKQKSRNELDELRAKKGEAEEKGLATEAAVAQRDIDELVKNYRRGLVQNLHHAHRCPDIVMAALYFKASGEVKNGFDAKELPSTLTTGQVKKLFKAFQSDMEILEDGAPKYNKGRPGPNFVEAWEKILTDDRTDAKGKKEKAAKSMSAKDIQTEISEGTYRSHIAINVSRHCSGEKDIEGIPADDLNAYYGQLVSTHQPDLWTDIINEAKSIEKSLTEQDKEAK